MQGFITVKQAVERLGVSRQTVINWANEGAIKIHNIGGKQYWLDANSVEALKDTAKETAEQMEKLIQLKKELENETEKVENLIKEAKRDLGIIKGTYNLTVAKDFYVSIPNMMFELGLLHERQKDIIVAMIEEKSLEKAANMYGITRERARQIFVIALRKSADITRIKEKLSEIDNIKKENQLLKLSIEALQKELEEYHRMRALTMEMDEKEKRKAFLEKDELCLLLSTKLNEHDFSVRTLNCLYARNIQTVGELMKYSRIDLLKLKNFGRFCLSEVECFADAHGLSFGMDVDKVFRERLDLLVNTNIK